MSCQKDIMYFTSMRERNAFIKARRSENIRKETPDENLMYDMSKTVDEEVVTEETMETVDEEVVEQKPKRGRKKKEVEE